MSLTLQLEIDDRALQATLLIPAGMTPQLEQILHLVTEKRLNFGLIKKAIKEACAPCNTDKKIVIAKGLSPQESTVMPVHSDFINPLFSENESPVVANQYLGYLEAQTPNRDGMNVFGKKIVALKKNSFFCIGTGIDVRENQLYTNQAGVLIVDCDGCWQVVSDNDQNAVQDAREISDIQINTSPDYMRATVTLKQSEYMDAKRLSAAVQQQKISYGLRPSGIRRAIQARPLEREIIITEGLYPKHGAPAYLEYLIDQSIHFQTHENGNVDFKASSPFKNVTAGTALGRLHPASKGRAGMDIRGNKLPAKDGEEKNIEDFLDEGAACSADDPSLIIAARDGIFNRNQLGQIGVLNSLIIEGNVDMSTGNIETPYPVTIKGDIKAGFQVKSGSDITVEGVIEDARVSANGNLIVQKGILPGENRIKAQGDIAAPYIRGREIKAHNLTVATSIRRSTIQATGSIIAQEILGGICSAALNITLENLGSSSNHRTKVCVGLDPYLNALREACLEQIKQLQEPSQHMATHVAFSAKRASELVKKYTLLQNQGGIAESYKQQMRSQAKNAAEEHSAFSASYRTMLREINALHKKIDDYDQQMREMVSQSKVEVTGIVYAPCEIQIGHNAHYRISESISNIGFMLDGKGKIKLFVLGNISPSP